MLLNYSIKNLLLEAWTQYATYLNTFPELDNDNEKHLKQPEDLFLPFKVPIKVVVKKLFECGALAGKSQLQIQENFKSRFKRSRKDHIQAQPT
jgi:hypothetical protein